MHLSNEPSFPTPAAKEASAHNRSVYSKLDPSPNSSIKAAGVESVDKQLADITRRANEIAAEIETLRTVGAKS